jgi:hypothetical protein
MQSRIQFSVAVVGNMNPSIHHPAWYEGAGIFAADERPFAVAVVTPQVAQFQTKNLQIQCLPDKWVVTGKPGSTAELVVRTAAKTFERLNDTPVRAFGLNTTYEALPPPGEALNLPTDLADPLSADFQGSTPELESVTTRFALGELGDAGWRLHRFLRLTIAPRPTAVVFSTNVHHQIEVISSGTSTHFDLTPMLQSSSTVFQEVGDFLNALAQRLLSGSP